MTNPALPSPPVTRLSDLVAGTRIRHLRWRCTGTVKVDEYDGQALVHVPWDGSFVDDEISDEGVVFPEDVEIIGGRP